MTAYNFELFSLGRWTGYVWDPVEAASVSYSASYDPDDNGTLIIGSESIQITLSGYGSASLLSPLDVVQVAYDGHVIGVFTVDATDVVTAVDSDAVRHGHVVRVTCTSSAVGTYAAAQDTVVSWAEPLPTTDTPIMRVQHWVNVVGWELVPGWGDDVV